MLLVHGFGGLEVKLALLARNLSARGVAVDAITYAPFGTSGEQLAVEVDRLLCQTGAEMVHLVGHSPGVIVIVQAIASARLTGQIDTSSPSVVTFRGFAMGAPAAIQRDCAGAAERFATIAPIGLRAVPDGMRRLVFNLWMALVLARTVGGGGILPRQLRPLWADWRRIICRRIHHVAS